MSLQSFKEQFSLTSGNVASFLLVAFVFLIPLTFAPTPYVNFFYSKVIPLFVITIGAIFFFVIKTFRDGKYKIPFHPVFLIALLVPLWYFICSFFAVNSSNAFIGMGIETDTVNMVAILFLFALAVSLFLRSQGNALFGKIIIALGSSYIVLAVFHILRLFFGAGFLDFNLFLDITSNTVGKWNEMAVLSGLALLLSLFSIEFLKLDRNHKIFAYVILVLSVFLECITNFYLVAENSFQISFFSLIGIFAFVFFVYFLSSSYKQSSLPEMRKIPITSLIIVIISILFTFGYNEIGTYVQNHFHVSTYEERPTWKWTTQMAVSSIKQKPLTGYGPNNFMAAWNLNKPAEVNQTLVWSDDFLSGVGYIPTALVTVGPIGFILWLLFLIGFIILGIKSLFIEYQDPYSQYYALSSFAIGLFLWVTVFFYVPTTLILILTFLFTGLFLGALLKEGIISEKTFVFENDKQKTSVSVLFLLAILVASVSWTYVFGQKFASTVYAIKGAAIFSTAANEQDLLKAQEKYTEALRLSTSDSYLRAIASINLSRAQLLLNDQSLSPDQFKSSFLASYQNAYGASNDAIAHDGKNYQNYLVRAAVSESIVNLGVPSVQGIGISDAYEDAKNNYGTAAQLNPKNPLIPLLIARLDARKNNLESAKENIANALKLKNNYVDAYILLAQIQIEEKNEEQAIDTLLAGSVAAPDSNLFYLLGVIQYDRKDYSAASVTFGKALALNPYYSNARYYLALSYYYLGDTDVTIANLEQIKILNPDNQVLASMIEALKAGKPLPVPVPESVEATSTPDVSTLESPTQTR